LNDDDLETISRLLVKSNSCESLTLTGNLYGSRGVTAIASTLRAHSTRTVISMNSLLDVVLDSHATRAFFDNIGTLHHLHFDHRIRAEDELYVVRAMATALAATSAATSSTTTPLHSLSLSAIEWSVENITACLNLVAHHCTLTHFGIHLPANGQCVAVLCDMLTTTTRLASLNGLYFICVLLTII
jgi:hypothetical protein